ncbi:Hypothetical protein CINCED_3A012617 [Cinara cedri]|uniref:Uncharacterized protein n=1 Tax=Cinara cedri TaxID=506608 RepID=A0A5E4MNI9_9HEMI|nr:Hypothetical protein CINCED_3A012617 [Cinara cedri]
MSVAIGNGTCFAKCCADGLWLFDCYLQRRPRQNKRLCSFVDPAANVRNDVRDGEGENPAVGDDLILVNSSLPSTAPVLHVHASSPRLHEQMGFDRKLDNGYT